MRNLAEHERSGSHDTLSMVLSKRHDLKIPQDKFNELIKLNPHNYPDLLHHPQFNIDEYNNGKDPKEGEVNFEGLFTHPKASKELKSRILSHAGKHLNLMGASDKALWGNLAEKAGLSFKPYIQADEQEKKQQAKVYADSFLRGIQQIPQEKIPEILRKIGKIDPSGEALRDTIQSMHPDHFRNEDLKYHLPNLSDKQMEQYLKGGNKLPEITSTRMFDNITPEMVENVINSHGGFNDEKHAQLIPYMSAEQVMRHTSNTPALSHFLERNKIISNDDRAKIANQFYNPEKPPEKNPDGSVNTEKADGAFNITIDRNPNYKELPIKAFKRWYRGVDNNAPVELRGIAHEAMRKEAKARKHQLITRTLGPNGKEEDLHKYKFSHDYEVSDAAKKELARRGLK